MEDIVKKATTDLTEEIIQLRAENMVYKSVIELADDNIAELKKKLTKSGRATGFWFGMAITTSVLTIKMWKKYKAEVDYKKWKADIACTEDFESDFDTDE